MSSDKPPLRYNVDELREWLRPKLEQPGGVQCPVCRQHAQAYKRQVTGPMVAVMAALAREQRRLAIEQRPQHIWVHLADLEQKSRDTASLAYWRLIEQHPEHRGEWRVTDEGQHFLRGDLRISKYAHVYSGRPYGFSGETVDVFTVAPGFNYETMIEGRS